jgi:hypothetical protein
MAVALTVTAGSVQADDLSLAEPPDPIEVWGFDSAQEPDWGIEDASVLRIHASEFRPQNSSTQTTTSYWNTGITYINGSASPLLHAPVILPTGALIVGIGFDGYDVDPSLNINWGLYWVTTAASDDSGNYGWYVHTTSAGFFAATAARAGDVVEPDRYLFALVDLNKTGQDMRIKGMRVHYKLQISPAPAVATFSDVPVGAFGFKHVEALAASGITTGCGGGNFCPNQPLTRVQMAVFLAKALGLHWPN